MIGEVNLGMQREGVPSPGDPATLLFLDGVSSLKVGDEEKFWRPAQIGDRIMLLFPKGGDAARGALAMFLHSSWCPVRMGVPGGFGITPIFIWYSLSAK